MTFLGAARTVTGSKYLIGLDSGKILIDCGLFQGSRELRQLNWNSRAFDPSELDVVILTHAHIDHIGYLPRLVKQGFRKRVYATEATIDLAKLSLLDTAHLQMEDASYRARKKISRHELVLPLYDIIDAEKAIEYLTAASFDKELAISTDVRFRLRPAGHILGAASVELILKDKGTEKKILFSGDLGRYGNPMVIDPAPPPECDVLVCESTYGGKIHEPESPYSIFADLINEAIARKRVILIPAFAVSRTQQITYIVNDLIRHNMIPPIDIHIDSPMAISTTDIYCKYHWLHRIDLKELTGGKCILEGPNVHMHRDQESSKALNDLKGPAIIMSASGMMTGGRIMHHLINRLPDPNAVVVIAGFMAEGTLGRKLLDGEKLVYIHKQPVEVKARIVTVHSLSGHADSIELMHWLEPIKNKPRRVYVTHGENSRSEALAEQLKKEKGWNCYIPSQNETVHI